LNIVRLGRYSGDILRMKNSETNRVTIIPTNTNGEYILSVLISIFFAAFTFLRPINSETFGNTTKETAFGINSEAV
jgi:hypothetical protein